MKDLQEARARIDALDTQIVRLFEERMDAAADIAAYKQKNGLPVLDTAREREKLLAVGGMAREDTRAYAQSLYRMMFEVSRAYQRARQGGHSALADKLSAAVRDTPPLFPQSAVVACQGAEGAYAQRACEKLFSLPKIMYFSSFEGVFRAIDQGLCRYGVLPLENSTAGSVNSVYDLMMRYDFSIVRAARLKVEHCLLALPGVQLKDVRTIVSHEQALRQCEGYIRALGSAKAEPMANTAEAARYLLSSGRRNAAAIASRDCAALYGLNCLEDNVQDNKANYTRFICISKQLEVYPGANKTSVMLSLQHKPGALYNALGRFYALDVNLSKLESRPLPGSDFEFMFYFDLDTSVYSPALLQALSGLEDACTAFKYLGSYAEEG